MLCILILFLSISLPDREHLFQHDVLRGGLCRGFGPLAGPTRHQDLHSGGRSRFVYRLRLLCSLERRKCEPLSVSLCPRWLCRARLRGDSLDSGPGRYHRAQRAPLPPWQVSPVQSSLLFFMCLGKFKSPLFTLSRSLVPTGEACTHQGLPSTKPA